MKLIIQIPCLNEQDFIGLTLSKLPKSLDGVDTVEYLVIDDGSTDRTAEAARDGGAHHVLRLEAHRGLAAAFTAGLAKSLELGADIIVNTDADNQYNADDMQDLIAPILAGRAGMTIGARPISEISHFSWSKKLLQKVGSRMISMITRTEIEDAPSGFRALSREAALRLNIFTGYTYTLESIIQARFKNIRIETVPVRVNEKLRESRLVKSNISYIMEALKAVFWILLIYSPGKLFARFGLFMFAAGTVIGLRFLYFYFTDGGRGHVQSLILLSVLFMLGLGALLISILSELISTNRRLSEDIQYRLKKSEYGNGDGRR